MGKSTFAESYPVSVVSGAETPINNDYLIERPHLAITTTSLPNGQRSASYSASLQASGGRPFHYWSLESGSGALPNGLTMNGKGELQGTATAAGGFNFSVPGTGST